MFRLDSIVSLDPTDFTDSIDSEGYVDIIDVAAWL